MTAAPVVIIGTGHAGYTLAREFRKQAPGTPLTLISADDGAAYYKPNLSKAFADGKDAQALVMKPAEAQAEALGATVLVNTRVTGIDPQSQSITTDTDRISYSKLVLAVGANQRACPVEGDGIGSILHVNSLADYRDFRSRLHSKKRVAILGAGLIGCEFANDLSSNGFKVTLIDPLGWPLGRLVPEPVGVAIGNALHGLGVHLGLRQMATAVNHSEDGFAVTTSHGATINADVVLSAIGLVPNTGLADAAGLACGRGIQVDATMQTSNPNIFALGDCAELPGGQVLPYVLPITHCARTLAKTLAGEPTKLSLPAMPVIVKTPVCPTVVCPPATDAGAWRIDGDSPNFEAVFESPDGEPLGFALTGDKLARRGELAKTMPPLLA